MISRWHQEFQRKGPELFADQRDPLSRRKALGVQTRSLLLHKGFVPSMSRAGTPTDIGMRNALSASSSWLELHVAPIIRWGSFCERLRHGSTFILKSDQHAGLDNLSPLHSAQLHELEDIPSLALW